MPESSELAVKLCLQLASFNQAVGRANRALEAFSAKFESVLSAFREMVPPPHVHTDWLAWLGFKFYGESGRWVSPFFGEITWEDAVFRWR